MAEKAEIVNQRNWNRLIAAICVPAGVVLLFLWRDLGLTVLLIGVANYVFYRRESNWVVV